MHRRCALFDITKIVPHLGGLHTGLDGVTVECPPFPNFIRALRPTRDAVSMRHTSPSKTISRALHAR